MNVHKCNGNVCRPYAGPEEGVDVFLGFRNMLCFPKSLELTTSNVVKRGVEEVVCQIDTIVSI